jgi:hypothetical protein
MRRTRNWLIFIAVIGAYAGFIVTHKQDDSKGWNERDQKFQKLDEQMKSLSEEIKFYQGHSSCTSASQCRVVGLGIPTCGGFKDFIIYSLQDAQETVLLEKITAFNEKAKEFSDLSLQAAGCGKKAAKIQCIKGQCNVVQ